MKTFNTQIYVWSAIGHTPITRRSGAYCDELVKTTITAESPADAEKKLLAIMKNTPYADKGHFYMPEWPNQNTHSNWVNIGQTYQKLTVISA